MCIYVSIHIYMNNHVHSAPQSKKEESHAIKQTKIHNSLENLNIYFGEQPQWLTCTCTWLTGFVSCPPPQILNSLTYTNLHSNNSVTDGRRNITLTTTDMGSLASTTLTILISVAERNDGPAIDLGGGENVDVVVTYIENSPPVAIGLSHLIEVMDEEGNNVSSVVIELVSTNGELDEGDTIFLRTPMALPFVRDPNTVVTKKLINITLTDDSASYTEAIQAVRYENTEREPTLFVNGTTNLSREVVIRITDASTMPSPTTNEVRVGVRIEPINDNAPRIIINSDPVCTEDCRDSGTCG